MPRGDRREIAAIGIILGLAVALRVPGLLNDLWLDEIESLRDALAARSWVDVLVGLNSDNNHHLNSLWMRWVGDGASPTSYRLLSMTAGLGTVVMAWLIGRRDSVMAGLTTALLFTISFPFVHYSSEARGYSLVVFLMLASLYCLTRLAERASWTLLVAFWSCSALGVLAHQTFLLFFLGSFLWFNVHVERSTGSVRRATRRMAWIYLPAAVAMGTVYLLCFRNVEIQGGPGSPAIAIAALALSVLASGPAQGGLIWITGGIAAVAVAAAIIHSLVRHDDRWLLYVSGGIVIPALFVLGKPTVSVYARYFIVPSAILLLAVATSFSDALIKSGWPRFVAGAAIGAMCLGCLQNVRDLYVNGRGRFDDAVRHMTASQLTPVSVASVAEFTRHDDRVRMQLDYYAHSTHREGRVAYVTQATYPARGTDWMIREAVGVPSGPARWVDQYGNAFVLEKTYPAAPLAGISWLLYRSTLSDTRSSSVQ